MTIEIRNIRIGKNDQRDMIQDLQGQQAQVTSWVWNGIPLKSELKMGEITQTIEVLELEEVSEVPAKYVTIPEDAKITEM